MEFYLSQECQANLGIEKNLKEVFQLEGEIFRATQNRETLKVTTPGKSYFVKRHRGVGWKEVFKNLCFGRLPILGAQNEWLAIQKLHEIGIDTMVLSGYGTKGKNPAKQSSFLITEALEDCESLETLAVEWQKNQPPVRFKRRLITTLANISKKMHSAGVNHRDFYLCHFLMPKDQNLALSDNNKNIRLFLIDLHRAQIRTQTPNRWRIKDLAGLYFSSLHLELSQRDYFRFIRAYSGASLREALKTDKHLWLSVEDKAQKLFKKALSQGIVPEVSA